jgi:isoquinoline 1-oxidoreductase alpha subunit
MSLQLQVNGKTVNSHSDADTPLLWVLRDELGMTGTKFGCGSGLCGACTVHVNGDAVRSCQTQIGTAAGQKVSTVESLGATGSHALQKAWVKHQVPQCGYCQSGQLMSAAALLSKNKNPSDDDIDAAMAGNICRCGTYTRIRAAVKDAASMMRTA